RPAARAPRRTPRRAGPSRGEASPRRKDAEATPRRKDREREPRGTARREPEPPVVGLGDHVPAFLTRQVKAPPEKPERRARRRTRKPAET
ncbi:MAG: hypothetical protein WD673_07085, partial [Alphaproteobacteria bacterium]